MDVVIKLFVLSQIRAVVTRIERITPELMKRVYEDELKPIHPMIDALRSGDITKIARYSDLTIPDVDRKILELSNLLQSHQENIDVVAKYRGNEQAIRLHNMLVDTGYNSDLLEPLINKAFADHPQMLIRDLMPLILTWYQNAGTEKPKPTTPKAQSIKKTEWHTLDSDDLRFLHSQAANDVDIHKSLQQAGLLFDSEQWINSFR